MNSTTCNVLLDTNALWLSKTQQASLVHACQSGILRVYIPALVLVERERQLVQRDCVRAAQDKPTELGRAVSQFRQFISQLVFDLSAGAAGDSPVLTFDRRQAEWVGVAWREWLVGQSAEYLTRELEMEETVEELRCRLHKHSRGKKAYLPDLDWMIEKADWSIAAVARHTGWLLVTNDRGVAFQQTDLRVCTTEDFIRDYLKEE